MFSSLDLPECQAKIFQLSVPRNHNRRTVASSDRKVQIKTCATGFAETSLEKKQAIRIVAFSGCVIF